VPPEDFEGIDLGCETENKNMMLECENHERSGTIQPSG
jgi:hypothetical protein